MADQAGTEAIKHTPLYRQPAQLPTTVCYTADQAGTEAIKHTPLDRQPAQLPTTVCYTADQAGTEAIKHTALYRQPAQLPTTVCYTSALAYFPIFRTSRLAVFHSNIGSNNHVLIFAKFVLKIG